MLKKLEHAFKAAFFAACRAFLRKGRPERGRIDLTRVKKVLFLRPEKLGDTIISLPTFEALRRAFPQIKIGLLASPRNRIAVQDDPRIDQIYLYRKNLIRDIAELLRIRKARYDVVLDMIWDDSMTTLFYSHLAARGKPCIGTGKMKTAVYYDYNYTTPDSQSAHVIDNTLGLLGCFGIDSRSLSRYAAPYVPQTVEDQAKSVLKEMGCSEENRTVGINLSAGKPNRIWGLDRAEKLTRMILEENDQTRVLLIVTPADRSRGADLCGRFKSDRVRLVPDNAGLTLVIALIGRLAMLISPDTSLVHIARSMQVPVVGLYSGHRRNLNMWRPYGQKTGTVASGDNDHIFDITPEQVFEAYSALMKQTLEANQK